MSKTYRIPVIVTKSDDFGDIYYDAQGTGEYWDIMSDVYKTADEALKDIYNQIKPVLQQDINNYDKLFVGKVEDISLEDNQKIKFLEIRLD